MKALDQLLTMTVSECVEVTMFYNVHSDFSILYVYYFCNKEKGYFKN